MNSRLIRRASPRLEARAPQTAQMNINGQDLRPLNIPVTIARRGLMTDLLHGRVRVP